MGQPFLVERDGGCKFKKAPRDHPQVVPGLGNGPGHPCLPRSGPSIGMGDRALGTVGRD